MSVSDSSNVPTVLEGIVGLTLINAHDMCRYENYCNFSLLIEMMSVIMLLFHIFHLIFTSTQTSPTLIHYFGVHHSSLDKAGSNDSRGKWWFRCVAM